MESLETSFRDVGISPSEAKPVTVDLEAMESRLVELNAEYEKAKVAANMAGRRFSRQKEELRDVYCSMFIEAFISALQRRSKLIDTSSCVGDCYRHMSSSGICCPEVAIGYAVSYVRTVYVDERSDCAVPATCETLEPYVLDCIREAFDAIKVRPTHDSDTLSIIPYQLQREMKKCYDKWLAPTCLEATRNAETEHVNRMAARLKEIHEREAFHYVTVRHSNVDDVINTVDQLVRATTDEITMDISRKRPNYLQVARVSTPQLPPPPPPPSSSDFHPGRILA